MVLRGLLCLSFKRLAFALDLVLGLLGLRVDDILLTLGELPWRVVLERMLAMKKGQYLSRNTYYWRRCSCFEVLRYPHHLRVLVSHLRFQS